jgi:hypothetical protein
VYKNKIDYVEMEANGWARMETNGWAEIETNGWARLRQSAGSTSPLGGDSIF